MSNQIQFNDQDLKQAIMSHWANQGVQVMENTADQMVQQVKSKLKNNTSDELKLALSELKLELTPTTSASEYHNLLIASHLKNIKTASYILLEKTAEAYKNMGRQEIMSLLGDLTQLAKESGRTLEEQKKYIDSLIGKIDKRLVRVTEQISALSNFDEKNTADQDAIVALIANPQLQQLTEQEHASLKGGRAGKESEAKRVGYTPEQIKLINQAFSPASGSVLPTMNSGYVSEGRSNERILWTRKRFAFERALGRDNTSLYQKRKAQYQGYVVYKKREALQLKEQRHNLDRLRTVGRSRQKLSENLLTRTVEHAHTAANKAAMEQIAVAMMKYREFLTSEEEFYSKYLQEYGRGEQNLKMIQQDIADLVAIENPEPISAGDEKVSFDPEALFELRRDSQQGEAIRQPAKIGPSVWSITPEGGEKAFTKGMDTTWQNGQAIYKTLDPETKQSQMDARTILTYRDSPKITQNFKVGPYATDEQVQSFVQRLENLPTRGMSDQAKKELADGNAHWSLLWNLAKKDVTKDNFSKELGFSGYQGTNGKEKALIDYVYKQMPSVNSQDIRMMVAGNKNTPDWVLMYIAESDPSLQTFAQKQLGLRGWKIKKDAEGNPQVSDKDGSWIWEKTKTASITLSPREAQTTPAIPISSPTAPGVSPQMRSMMDQSSELDRQNQELLKKRQALTVQMQQETAKSANPAGGQAPTPTQATDNTNAPKPPAPLPFAPIASWKSGLSWREKFFDK